MEVEITEIVNEHDVSYTLYKASFENEVFGIRNHYEDLTYDEKEEFWYEQERLFRRLLLKLLFLLSLISG